MRTSSFILFFLYVLVFSASSAFAADVFDNTVELGAELFNNIRPIIYILGAFGLAGFSAAAIFGKIHWAWLASLTLGLFLISAADGVIQFITNDNELASKIRQTGSSGSILPPTSGETGGGTTEQIDSY